VPEGPVPAGGRKVVAFTHGTVGIASDCAPSLQRGAIAQVIEGIGEFVAAGYVVAMPNPRGSMGYGEAFMHAVVNDWGGGDFEDLMAVVDRLVRRGVADPERLFVMGYSYGGFMTAWTIGHTDRFRAALIGAPVANHVGMRGTSDIPLFSDYHIGGSPYDNADEWRARSPVTHLPNVTAAVLIEHHEGDLRCPIGQAEEIFQNLKLLGKEVEFLRYPGGSHGLCATMKDRVSNDLLSFVAAVS